MNVVKLKKYKKYKEGKEFIKSLIKMGYKDDPRLCQVINSVKHIKQ
tara:strand:+ start:283 stop:420 length:138 start_codon:yes stop_codon:yes gene_type:complete